MKVFLEETNLLDFSDKSIQNLIAKKQWRELDDFDKIKTIYNFVRDEILFGYNLSDKLPASKILKDGFGQCNTKGILFMALLRAVGIPCRIHGFMVDKKLQKGVITGLVYKNSPNEILHSWVEVYFASNWFKLEAFILDRNYLNNLQRKFPDCKGEFCGYGVAVKDFKNPVIEWNKNDTFIQSESITKDLGVFDSPDALFDKYKQNLSKVKEFLYKNIGRHIMNKNVKRIRKHK